METGLIKPLGTTAMLTLAGREECLKESFSPVEKELAAPAPK